MNHHTLLRPVQICLWVVTGLLAYQINATAAVPYRKIDNAPENDLALLKARSDFAAGSTHFLENKGQVWDKEGQKADYVDFILERGNTSVFLLGDGGMAWQFNRTHFPIGYEEMMTAPRHEQDIEALSKLSKEIRTETFRMDMMLEGANPHAAIRTEGRSADYYNYYNRNARDVHHYEKVTYEEVYPGIDWVVYTTKAGIKYDFVVKPGADPNRIQLRFTHHESLYLDAEGNLIHGNGMGQIIENAPVSYQLGHKIDTRFVLENDLLLFRIDKYNPDETLTIDPARIWGTYYGGSSSDEGRSCSTDATGNVYLAGFGLSTTNIADGGYQNSSGGYFDAFLVKFDASGTRLWGTHYGGSNIDFGLFCATDSEGNVYLAGSTESTTNIAADGHQNSLVDGFYDAFLVKFDASGTRLWGTYYGGSGFDEGYSCSTDASGNIYLAGSTQSLTNIAADGHQDSFGEGFYDAFLVKFNASGTRLWGTYYGGNANDIGFSCTTDVSGNVYLVGYTASTTNISNGGHQNSFGGFLNFTKNDAFLVKFNSSGTRLWGTYYGESDDDYGLSCTTDPAGNVYLAGTTASAISIANAGHQNSYKGSFDAMLVKFDASGTRLWGTYYGGSNIDEGYSCSTDVAGNVYLAGYTESSNNIAAGGHQDTFDAGQDAFLVKFDASGTRLWGTYYGGSNNDAGYSCSTDVVGNIFLAGNTVSSTNIASGGHQNIYGGSSDGFLVKFEGESCTITASCSPSSLTLSSEGTATLILDDVNNGSTASCGAPILSLNQINFDATHIGENTVILTVEDENGNTDTCQAVVTVLPNPGSCRYFLSNYNAQGGSDVYEMFINEDALSASLNHLVSVPQRVNLSYNNAANLLFLGRENNNSATFQTLNPDNGILGLPIGVNVNLSGFTGAAFGPDGMLYAASQTSGAIYRFNPSNFTGSLFSSALVNGGDIDFDTDGKLVLVSRNPARAYFVNQGAQNTILGPVPNTVSGLARTGDGNFLLSVAGYNKLILGSTDDGDLGVRFDILLNGAPFTPGNGDLASGCPLPTGEMVVMAAPNLSENAVNAQAVLSSQPNPTDGISVVRFKTEEGTRATLEVYDMNGRNISTLFNQVANAGQEYRIDFDGTFLPNGVYIYRLTTENEVIVEKFMIAR